jgi:hypothetical protein
MYQEKKDRNNNKQDPEHMFVLHLLQFVNTKTRSREGLKKRTQLTAWLSSS